MYISLRISWVSVTFGEQCLFAFKNRELKGSRGSKEPPRVEEEAVQS